MHTVCTKGNFSTLAGTNVEDDFSEMPSQMLENWVWDPQMNRRISKHYITGKPMSDKMIDTLIKIDND